MKRYRLLATLAALGAVASVLAAPPPPSVTSVTILENGTAEQGQTVLRVGYGFPETGPWDCRRLDIFFDGQYVLEWGVGYGDPSTTGTADVFTGLYCNYAKGSHAITVRARTGCAIPGFPAPVIGSSQTVALMLDSPKVLSATASVEANGQGTVTVAANFTHTHNYTERHIEVWFNDAQLFGTSWEGPIIGTQTYPINVGCLPPGSYPLKVVARRCHQQQPRTAPWIDEVTTTASVPSTVPKIELAIDKGFDAQANRVRRKGTVTWDMGSGANGRELSVDLLNWTAADGETNSGQHLWPPGGAVIAQAGTAEFFFDAPRGSQQFVMGARAASCVGTATQEVSVDCSDCDTETPDPVALNDGNVQVPDVDALPAIAGHMLRRTYNSDEQVVALFGRGWTSLFERRVIVTPHAGEYALSVVDETNDVVTFRGSNGQYRQTWPQARTATSELRDGLSAGTFVYRAAGSMELATFRAGDGRLIELRDLRTGHAATITYDGAGRPQSIADSWSGVAWNLTVDATKRVVTSIAVSSRPDLVWTYNYDASGNLTSVLAPGSATWRTYEYSGNRLTASRDALGNLIESHTYDASGYGTASTGPSDEIASIQYGIATSNSNERITRVTAKNGNVTDYILRPSGGAWRTVRVVNGCGSCGARDVSLARDAKGRVVRRQHADGYVTTYTYAATQRVIDGGDRDNGGGPTVVSDGIERLVSTQSALQPAGCDPETSATRCMQDPTTLATIVLEPTAATLTTNYEYGDPKWPERVTVASTPSISVAGQIRRKETQYHAVTGEVIAQNSYGWMMAEGPVDRDGGGGNVPARLNRSTVTRFYGEGSEDSDDGAATSIAPAFVPGGTFATAWLSLPQPSLMRKMVDGPRTDVVDITSFVYYPIDAGVPANLRGRLAATRNAAGHITRFEGYDVFGNVTRVVDANGVATEIAYDALGRVTTTTIKSIAGCDTAADPLCATDLTATRTYEPVAGPLQREQRPDGGVTTYTYDSRGRVETISRGPSPADLRERIEYTYDPQTGHKSVERILGFENGAWVEKTRETYRYDALRQLQSVTHADATSIAYTYDHEGRVATVRDENHSIANTSYTYDPAGRVRVVAQKLATAPGGMVTTHYSYDVHGNLKTVTDPNGNATSYTSDDFGQLLSQQSPVTGTSRYEYDEAGNVKLTEDANGAITQRTHDALNRVLTTASTRAASSETVTWTYDNNEAGRFAIGRPAEMSDPTGSTSYLYERRGLLREEVKTIEGTAYTTGFQYDEDGNRSLIRYPSGRIVQYSFDFAGRPSTASLGSTQLVTSARYLPFGPAKEIVFGNGTTKAMEYDSRYRLERNELLGGEGEPLVSYDYGYDAVGNITRLHDLRDPAFNRDFGYDDLNRLTSASTGEALWGEGSYSYDAMGNMRSAQLGHRGRSFIYSGTTSKLLSVAEGENVQPVSYDAAGNETTFGASSSVYTPRNLLASHDGVSYGYDGRGLRTIARRSAHIASLTLNPATVDGGSSSQAVVTLSAAPSGNAVVTLTADSALVTLPPSVIVPAGQKSATFTVATQAVEEQTVVTIAASYNGATRAETLTLTRPRFDALAVSPSSVTGGNAAELTVTLSTPAPQGGVSVPLASSSASASVPPQLVIAGGTTRARTSISTSAVSERTVATFSAVIEGTARQASLVLLPVAISIVSFSPNTLHGGATTTGTISLTGPAPQGGITVLLATEADALSLPSGVTIAAGAQSATFTVGVAPVERETRARVNAFLGESIFEALVTITPPQLAAFEVNPGTVIGGELMTAQTELDAPAAEEGARVDLASSDPETIPHPVSIVVPGGSERAAAVLQTLPVTAAMPVVLSATRNGVTRSATITVQPPVITLASLAVQPSSLVGTNPATGTVTLTGPAPAPIEVELTSNDSSVSVPPAVVVSPGQVSAAFTMTTSLVTSARAVTVTASHATTEKTATIAVLPPVGNYVSSISVAPSVIAAGTTALGKVTLALPSANKTDVALTSSDSSVAIVPVAVTIKNKDMVAEFIVAASNVATPSAVTISANYGGAIQQTKVIVAPANTVALSSLVITPPRVTSGNTATALLTLTGPAPAGGAVVTIYAKRRSIVTVPASAVIAEGALSVAFVVAANAVQGKRDKATEIVASYNSVDVSAVVTVAPRSTASTSASAVARCASLALIPCLTRASLNDVAAATNLASETTHHLYSPELRLLAETVASIGTAPQIGHEYIWFGDQPLAQVNTSADTVHWYLADHLGTPLLQTDLDARIVWQPEYEPYGAVHAFRRGESKHQPLRFPGQEVSAASNVTYNIHRWYRAVTGRYTQFDPGWDRRVNPFSYVSNNPLVLADPSGLWAVSSGKAGPGQNTIVCDGKGSIEPWIGAPGTPEQQECFADCLYLHELMHATDALLADPTICQGKAKGLIVLATGEEQAKTSEYLAYEATLDCLDSQLKLYTTHKSVPTPHKKHAASKCGCPQLIKDQYKEYAKQQKKYK